MALSNVISYWEIDELFKRAKHYYYKSTMNIKGHNIWWSLNPFKRLIGLKACSPIQALKLECYKVMYVLNVHTDAHYLACWTETQTINMYKYVLTLMHWQFIFYKILLHCQLMTKFLLRTYTFTTASSFQIFTKFFRIPFTKYWFWVIPFLSTVS